MPKISVFLRLFENTLHGRGHLAKTATLILLRKLESKMNKNAQNSSERNTLCEFSRLREFTH